MNPPSNQALLLSITDYHFLTPRCTEQLKDIIQSHEHVLRMDFVIQIGYSNLNKRNHKVEPCHFYSLHFDVNISKMKQKYSELDQLADAIFKQVYKKLKPYLVFH